jgi:hypothetical protein
MPTPCEPHANPMPTPCEPHANPIPHANPMPGPHANPSRRGFPPGPWTPYKAQGGGGGSGGGGGEGGGRWWWWWCGVGGQKGTRGLQVSIYWASALCSLHTLSCGSVLVMSTAHIRMPNAYQVKHPPSRCHMCQLLRPSSAPAPCRLMCLHLQFAQIVLRSSPSLSAGAAPGTSRAGTRPD